MCFMNKPKIDEKYLKVRLADNNVMAYVKSFFKSSDGVKILKSKTIPMKSFLQKNYGKDGDCTLSSILTLIYFYTKGKYSDIEIYDYIEKIAKKYLYNGDFYGSIPIFNKSIIQNVFKHFGVDKQVTCKYFKNAGFNLQNIQNILDANQPIVISIYKDGRKYYENHTITIIGYSIYTNNNNETKVLLKVLDN